MHKAHRNGHVSITQTDRQTDRPDVNGLDYFKRSRAVVGEEEPWEILFSLISFLHKNRSSKF